MEAQIRVVALDMNSGIHASAPLISPLVDARQLLRGEASQQQTWQVMRNTGWNPGIAGHMTTTPAMRAPCSKRAKGCTAQPHSAAVHGLLQ